MSQWQVLVGDVREKLATLPDDSVQCCVTSPPYWGLRDYGTASWDGGDPACAHSVGGQVQDSKAPGAITTGQRPGADASRCRACGAKRRDAQIGLEPTPHEYVGVLVSVFQDVWRVLKSDGTLWLNLGDSYAAGKTGRDDNSAEDRARLDQHGHGGGVKLQATGNTGRARPIPAGLKAKDMCGIPWRVAFALQECGWYLRSDIIWSKPNPMPESVTDRPTKAHEYIFLLSKAERYYYDADAIAEPASLAMQQQVEHGYDGLGLKDYEGAGVQNPSSVKTRIIANAKRKQDAVGKATYTGFNDRYDFDNPALTRNARSVWTVTTQPYPDAHFATFPEAIPEKCIKAGSKLGDTVLDPFCGSGTTGQVAIQLGRDFIGIELNPTYAQLARTRIGGAAPLFASEVSA